MGPLLLPSSPPFFSPPSSLTRLPLSALPQLNYQVVHHLFPSIAQPYYAAVAPIVVATAKEFGVHYVIVSSARLRRSRSLPAEPSFFLSPPPLSQKDTLMEAIGGHFALLQLLATPPHAH